MPDFIGVENGTNAQGYLIANGNVYPAVSGTSRLWDIPQGTYTYGHDVPLEQGKGQWKSMTDGNPAHHNQYRKFHIGTGPNQDSFIDPRTGRRREGIDFHFTPRTGSAGCIAYQDNAALGSLI